MSTLPQTAPQVTQNLSPLLYARKVLARDELLSDRMTALDASIFRELLLAAGLPTDAGMELLTLLLAWGGGESEVSVSDRELCDRVLPASDKTIPAKTRHLRYVRRRIRDAINAVDKKDEPTGFPIIQIDPGHGIKVDGNNEGVPTAYKLPILKLRRQVLRELPDTPDDTDIRQAAQAAVRGAFGGIAVKDHRSKKLRDVSAKTSSRAAIGHLRRVCTAKDGRQHLALALQQFPEVRPFLDQVISEKAPPPANLTPLAKLTEVFNELVGWAVGEVDDPRALGFIAEIANGIDGLKRALEESKNPSLIKPQVLSPQHGCDVTNFDVSGAEIDQESPAPTHPSANLREGEQASDPVLPLGTTVTDSDELPPPSVVLEGSGVITGTEELPAPLCGPSSVECQNRYAKLTPREQAGQELQAYESCGFDHVSFTIQRGKEALRYAIFPIWRALEEWSAWAEKADSQKASLIRRGMVGPLPHNGMTPEQQAVDDAAIRVREIPLDLDKDGRAKFERVRPWLFWGSSSSPGHFLGGICVISDKKTFDDLKSRMVKEVGSDPGASGANRSAGSKNWKPKHGGCPIELHHIAYGRVWTPAQIEASGLLAPPEPPRAVRPTPIHRSSSRKWPSYERELSKAPRKSDGKTPDYSSADLSWANIARMRGFSAGQIEDELARLRSAIDDKPRRNREYIKRTVDLAFSG